MEGRLPALHSRVRIGVLALQGAVSEHIRALSHVSRAGVGEFSKGAAAHAFSPSTSGGAIEVEPCEVKTPEALWSCDGLIIPGGESTTMTLIAERTGLWEPLQRWVAEGRPTWGTCAGLILLAKDVEGGMRGGQATLGGMDIRVQRNAFGAQVHSFEQPLALADGAPDVLRSDGDPVGVFIRAPAIASHGPSVEPLAWVRHETTGDRAASADEMSTLVAARSGAMLGTAFHPELTDQTAWHRLFVAMVQDVVTKHPASSSPAGALAPSK